MIDLLGCITALLFGLLLSNLEFINIKEAKTLTIFGWFIGVALYRYIVKWLVKL